MVCKNPRTGEHIPPGPWTICLNADDNFEIFWSINMYSLYANFYQRNAIRHKRPNSPWARGDMLPPPGDFCRPCFLVRL